MVNVDTVYQKVLALANKEQRGYITPQEFNLFADKAQLDIINDYFHKIKTSHLKPKNYSENSDDLEMVREKMSYIRNQASINIVQPGTDDTRVADLPPNTYMVATIYTDPIFDDDGHKTYDGGNEIVEVDRRELLEMVKNPLTRPTENRPVYIRRESIDPSSSATGAQQVGIDIHPGDLIATSAVVDFWAKPHKPNWGYVVVNEKTLYNFATSRNFEIHPSEEENLVMRILQLAGITIEKPELQQSVMVDQQQTKQNQNS